MFEEYKGVWVVAELEHGKVKSVTFELLTKARELALSLNEPVSCVLIGKDVKKHVQDVTMYGANKVYVIDHDEFEQYHTESYTNAIISLVKQYKPSIVLYPATKSGRDMAPRIAAGLETGLTADCTDLKINEKRQLVQIRPAFGGNIMAEIISPVTRPQMSTVRPNVFKKVMLNATTISETVEVPVLANLNIRTVIKEIVKTTVTGAKKLDEADIIISVGRGVGSKEGFQKLEEFANVVGAAVGCSRVAVDLGWMPKSSQVGQSGITVSPKLYIACGISGTIQHVVGMKNAKIIVAINKDPTAPIFNIADFGLVGDLHTILPILTEEFKNALKK